MEVLVALVLLLVGAVVVGMVLWRRHNQWDQTEAMRALKRLGGAKEEPVGNDDSDSDNR